MTQKKRRNSLIRSAPTMLGAGLFLFMVLPCTTSFLHFEHIVHSDAWAEQAGPSEEALPPEHGGVTKGKPVENEEVRSPGDRSTEETAMPEALSDEQEEAMPLVGEELKAPKAPWQEDEIVEQKAIPDKVHGAISKGVLATAEWLDSFFDDPRYSREVNRTRVKVRLDTFFEENEPVDFKTKVTVKLVLPRMKRKARLVVTGDPQEQEGEGVVARPVTQTPVQDIEDQDVTAALQYVRKETDRRNVSARIGVRWREGNPQVFVAPRYRVLIPVDSWDFRFTQEVLWWTDKGWESKTGIDFEHEFRNRIFVRTTAAGFWTEEENGYFYYLGMFVRQPLSPRRALSYEWYNYFKTRPVHVLNEVAVAVRFRQKIWRDWLFYEIAPQARFPREEGFDLIPGILFRLEFIFGRYQEERV